MPRLRSREVTAWAACADRLELPAEFRALLADAERVDAERAALVDDIGEPAAAERFASGEDLDGAVELDGAEREELRRRHEKRRAIRSAGDLVQRRLAGWVVAHRDVLIVDVARPVVDQLVAEARPLADKVAGLDEDAVLRHGTKVQADAWRRLRELQEAFDAVHEAWSWTWRAATKTGGQPPGALRAPDSARDAPAALRYWGNPAAVTTPLMRGDARDRRGRPRRIPTDLARIAAEPEEAGYRLAGLDELAEAVHHARLAEADQAFAEAQAANERRLAKQRERLERRRARA